MKKIETKSYKESTKQLSYWLYNNKRVIWYKLANSMGMYIESISKRIGQIAIEQIKKKEFSRSVFISIGIDAAINNTQIPENIKTNLIEAFASLDIVNVSLFSSQLLTKDIRMAGAEIKWKDGKNVIKIDIEFNGKTVQDFKTVLQEVYESICPVIRHELEHFVKNEQVNPRDKSKFNKPGHEYKNYVQMRDNPYGYYMNNQEIESHVAQIYMKAKNAKKSFEIILREFVDTQVYKILYYEAKESNLLNFAHSILEREAQQIAKNQAENVYNAYLRYAKLRYPKISDIAVDET